MKSISAAVYLKSRFGKFANNRLYGLKGLSAGAPDNSQQVRGGVCVHFCYSAISGRDLEASHQLLALKATKVE